MHIAIFDVGASFLQWVGKAVNVSEAVNKLQIEIGAWIDDADETDDSIHVYEINGEQAAKLDIWAQESALGNDRPVLNDEGRIYTVAEVNAMLA